jgi:hypothetical protein
MGSSSSSTTYLLRTPYRVQYSVMFVLWNAMARRDGPRVAAPGAREGEKGAQYTWPVLSGSSGLSVQIRSTPYGGTSVGPYGTEVRIRYISLRYSIRSCCEGSGGFQTPILLPAVHTMDTFVHVRKPEPGVIGVGFHVGFTWRAF